MSQDYPDLVFVAGPQDGQVEVIVGDVVVLGRSAECQLRLTEDYVSRKQMQLEKTKQGWLLENLSSNGTLVNNKRYKTGTRILLATGDIIGVALKTQILFVAPGDDREAAIEKYRQAHGSRDASQNEPATSELPEGSAGSGLAQAAGEGDTAVAAQGQAPGEAAQVAKAPTPPTAELGKEAKAPAVPAKYRKYAVLLGVSVVLTLIMILIGVMRNGGPVTPTNQFPKRLSEMEIELAIKAKPQVSPNHTMAVDSLHRAQALVGSIRPGDLYRCVKQFKLYLAYEGTVMFGEAADEKKWDEAINGKPGVSEGLIKMATREYATAMDLENAGRWGEAGKSLQKIIDEVPEGDSGDPTYQQLLTNVLEHYKYVQERAPKKKR